MALFRTKRSNTADKKDPSHVISWEEITCKHILFDRAKHRRDAEEKACEGEERKRRAKRDGRPEPRADNRESDVERARAAAALWELRLDATEQSRAQYREATRRLARANDDLTAQRYRAEKDMIDIISLLKTKDAEREEKIMSLEEQLKSQKALAREERETLVAEYTLRINELEDRFKKRSNDFDMIQVELKKIKEFRKRKAQMEQELSSIREGMHLADRNHMENLGRVETKFFTEKLRLEKEAEQRLAQLAESAHDEAIVKLDDASRSVFKENVRLNEALNYHMKEVEDVKKLAVSLAEENASMTMDKGTDALMIKKNAAQMKAYREEISHLKAKLVSLEQALELLAGEFEQERRVVSEKALVSSQAGQEDLRRLQKLLSVREREIARIKRLAGSVVEQRTELERFFHAALFQVKQEIQASRLVYKEQALKAYHARMSDARAGKQQYPLIRTFHINPHSTNCVYSDMEEAQKWTQAQSNEVDIADLTWEQKEKVLRLLFARMNGQDKTR
ncbi:Basal body-orientation factor 1 [Merluccius polli]|uniref:Basal body-orientation factor 1 n=1 Tax=Merluccius polli TaxID=89951 RepID=A0AA47M9Z2_MERPO|nr:Basal body-orientation factor 1 [Merluccius polli]